LDKLHDVYVPHFNDIRLVERQMECLIELKQYLKIFVKERVNQYKLKIELKLYGRYSSQKRGADDDEEQKEEVVHKKRKIDEISD
jgi:hypothetical protein